MDDAAGADATPERGASVDALLDRAIEAINRGDRTAATALAGEVLAVGGSNADVDDLLMAPSNPGALRRLTIFFADLVDSTALSTRVEPETYRLLVGRYRELVLNAVSRYEGHISSTKGDGLLAVFGHPVAHEDDTHRAVLAGLDIVREVARLDEQAKRRFGIGLSVRVGVHRGLVYLDIAQDDVYGFAANLAARVSGLAPPGSVVVSDAVAPLIRHAFDLTERPAAAVKGVDGLVGHHRVTGERLPTPTVAPGPLVGRHRELAELAKVWVRTRKGASALPGLVFRGEPGMGKSRLAMAAADLAARDELTVLEIFGSAMHADTGLHPVRSLIERRCGIVRSTEAAERLRLLEAEVVRCSMEPQAALRLLAPVLGIPAEVGYEPAPAEGRKLYELISEAVHTYLLACLGEGGGMVIVEDAHWLDPSTMEVLGALLNQNAEGLMVTVTGRPGDWLPAAWPVTVLDLTPLSDDEADALISVLNPALSAPTRAEVIRRCDGVPFYVEQVVGGGPLETGVPESLYETLFARLRTTPGVAQVVEVAAVIGRHFDLGLLRSVLALGDAEIRAVLDELEVARVLEPGGPDAWRFRHELIREVAAELPPPSVRRAIHARVADALVACGESDWRLVAGHFEGAERPVDAASAYERAASDARRRGALTEARARLTQALEQIDRAGPGPLRSRHEITVRLERSFLASAVEGHQSRSAAADFERCLQIGGTDVRDDALFATLAALLSYYTGHADLDRATGVIESLRAGLEHGRQWFRPAIETRTGMVAWLRGDLGVARHHLELATTEQAVDQPEQVPPIRFGPGDPKALAHIHLGLLDASCGDLAGGEAHLVLAAQRAEDLAFPVGPFSLGYTRFAEGWLCLEAGRFDRARQLAAEVIALGERHGFDFWRQLGGGQQAGVNAVAALCADPDPVVLRSHIATLAAIVDASRRWELLMYATFYDAILGRLLTSAGLPDDARRAFDAGLDLACDTGMHFYDAELLRLRARTRANVDERHADVSAALEPARRQGATLFELRAAVDDVELRGQPARAALQDVTRRFPPQDEWPELARAWATLGPRF